MRSVHKQSKDLEFYAVKIFLQGARAMKINYAKIKIHICTPLQNRVTKCFFFFFDSAQNIFIAKNFPNLQ